MCWQIDEDVCLCFVHLCLCCFELCSQGRHCHGNSSYVLLSMSYPPMSNPPMSNPPMSYPPVSYPPMSYPPMVCCQACQNRFFLWRQSKHQHLLRGKSPFYMLNILMWRPHSKITKHNTYFDGIIHKCKQLVNLIFHICWMTLNPNHIPQLSDLGPINEHDV